jgi:GT2 family glycosyltransferase
LKQSLTWSLVVATYNRADCLKRCVELALAQTRPPVEVIIVDASDPSKIDPTTDVRPMAAAFPAIRWVYESARVRSLPHQRNQCLEHATADVLFMIDDDSFMFPDAAEEVMKVYEADEQRKVAGVSVNLASYPPGSASPDDNGFSLGGSYRWLEEKLFMLAGRFYMDHLIQPYDGDYPSHAIPDAVSALGAYSIRHIYGMCMTFRREVIAAERFDEALLRYAANEDMDASYRVSRRGALVMAPRAKLFHAQSPSARLTRFTRTVLNLTNFAFLYRLNGANPDQLLAELRRGARRRMLVDLIGDLARSRWSLPRVRGDLHALQTFDTIRAMDPSSLRDWYTRFQLDLVDRNPS